MNKRFFDIIFSLLGLIVFFPFCIIFAIYIKFDSKGPVFFRQERIGLHGKKFLIYKLRTMYLISENNSKLTFYKDSRVTNSGKFLRKYKIDELPQLIDVFLGRMSIVGPRPEVEEYLDFYPPSIRRKILTVKPGITDMASVRMIDEGEILANYPDPRKAYIEVILPLKQKYYLEYIKENNLLLDVKIIFFTLKKIFTR